MRDKIVGTQGTLVNNPLNIYQKPTLDHCDITFMDFLA